MSSCVLLYSCFGQLIKDQPHLFVFEPHGLDRPIGFNWLRIHQGIKDFGLAVRRDRPITVEGGHGAGVAKILAVGLPLFRRPAYFLAEHVQGVPKTMRIVIGEPRPIAQRRSPPGRAALARCWWAWPPAPCGFHQVMALAAPAPLWRCVRHWPTR